MIVRKVRKKKRLKSNLWFFLLKLKYFCISENIKLAKLKLSIEDNYPKYVNFEDTIDMSQDGIIHKNIIDWLLVLICLSIYIIIIL